MERYCANIWAIGTDFQQLLDSETFASLQTSLATLRKMKIPVVIAAGNSGSGSSSYLLATLNWFGLLDPAIILVGATDLTGTQSAKFSSAGNVEVRPDVSMVGEGLTFWNQHGGIKDNNAGTSFAAPFTARIVAKMRDINPSLSVEAIQAILKMTAHDMPSDSPLVEGAGFVQAAACLYVSFVYGRRIKSNDRENFAQELGIQNREDLDWLAKRIRRQVFWFNTTSQGYGE